MRVQLLYTGSLTATAAKLTPSTSLSGAVTVNTGDNSVTVTNPGDWRLLGIRARPNPAAALRTAVAADQVTADTAYLAAQFRVTIGERQIGTFSGAELMGLGGATGAPIGGVSSDSGRGIPLNYPMKNDALVIEGLGNATSMPWVVVATLGK